MDVLDRPEVQRLLRVNKLRLLISRSHPLDDPAINERVQKLNGKRSNSPLLWLREDGSRA